jgi:predicted RecA/RadA family phage recombinase
MKNFRHDGKTVIWTNGTGADVAAGAVVVVGTLIGVACVDIANGATGAVAIEGVFELLKATHATDKAFTQGAAVIWDVSAGKFDVGTATPAEGDITGNCVAAAAAASTAAVALIKINVGAGTVTPAG